MPRRTTIIAEAGVNHNGSVERAMEMVRAAAHAGADYVKFQTFHSSELVSRCAELAEYQKKNIGDVADSQLEMLRKLELPTDVYPDLIELCRCEGIRFLSTPFDLGSIDFLSRLDMDFWKVPSGEITNYPYLRRIAGTGRRVVMSCGMCTMEEIGEALQLLRDNGTPWPVTVLHCNTQYPTPFRDVNLRAMLAIGDRFGVPVGYSDHTPGIEIPIAAVALGAEVIEKHFTLDRNLPGPDHKASLEPAELATMVSAVRNVEVALGNGVKDVSESEKPNLSVARKSIVAACRIAKGEILSDKNLTVKRPGNGISPMRWPEVIGQTARRDFREDELIEL